MARMVASPRKRLTLVLLLCFGGTAAGVLVQRPFDGVLRVESWAPEIASAARQAGLEDPNLLAGLVYAESRGRPRAQSNVEAGGLCQLIPATADELAVELQLDGPPYSPEDNLLMGAVYLHQQLERFDQDVNLALLAYRMGPTAVQNAIRKNGGVPQWLEKIRRQKPSPWEYRTQVLRFRERFQEREVFGPPHSS